MEQKPEPENKPLTWEQAKDEVARKRTGCKDWLTMRRQYHGNPAESFYYEAAELYAESAFHRGAREQERKFVKMLKKELYRRSVHSDGFGALSGILEQIQKGNAPAPEFKA